MKKTQIKLKLKKNRKRKLLLSDVLPHISNSNSALFFKLKFCKTSQSTLQWLWTGMLATCGNKHFKITKCIILEKLFLHMFSHNLTKQKCQTALKLEHVEVALRHTIISHNKSVHQQIAGIFLGCDMSLETKG